MTATKQHLTHLESTGLLRLAQTHPELEYLFRHALVQDAAYESLLIADRKQLHRQVAETLERLYPDRLDELAAVLGLHFAKTGEMGKAIDYLFLAGKRARQLYANEEAIEHFQQALILLREIPPDNVPSTWRDEMATQLYEGLGDVRELIGQHEEARNAYVDALAAAPKRDLVWQARLHRKTAYTFMMRRQDEAALQAYRQAEAALGQEPVGANAKWWQEWIQLQLEWMEAYYWQAQPHQMAELAKKVWPVIEQYATSTQRTLFFNRLIQQNLRRDRYIISDETMGYVETMWIAAQKSDNLGQKYHAQFTLGFSHLWLGSFDESEKHLNASLAAAERTGDPMHQARCLTYLTILFRKCGQMEKVQQYASRALTIATTLQMVEYVATAKANLAWIAWREEELPEAQKYGQTALELWPADYPFQWTALYPLIAVSLAQDQLSEAIGYTRTLLNPVQQRMPDTLTTELEEALLKWEEGQSEETCIHLHQAVKLAQEVDYL